MRYMVQLYFLVLFITESCCFCILESSRARLLNSKFASTENSSNYRQEKLKADALELLDCLTSSSDENDPSYSLEKDIRRDNLLRANDYHDLKMALKSRGLRTSGDKLEMITRLLVNIVDPSINYSEMYVTHDENNNFG